ncbi:nitrogen utilization protein B, partial [Psychrobacter sp. 16-Bac2893]
RLEIPYKVVLDEAMKLNNHFGATDAHKLINAVLDRMAVELRAPEVDADSKANLRTSQKAAAKPVTKADKNTDINANNSDIEEKPTASNKPRISANNASVKRNSVSKALANITDYKASKQNDTHNTVEEIIIKPISIETVIVDKADEIAVSAENIANDQPVEENIAASNDKVTAEVELLDSNSVDFDTKSAESNDADEKSKD